MGHCFIEAIRSVTHLVLAPEPKKLFWFFFFSFLYTKSFFVFVFSYFSSDLCAHPATAGPENIQYRSAFIQFVRTLVSPTPVARRRRPTRF